MNFLATAAASYKKNQESIRDATAELQVKIIWSCYINKKETKE
jgi:hypothetical protein